MDESAAPNPANPAPTTVQKRLEESKTEDLQAPGQNPTQILSDRTPEEEKSGENEQKGEEKDVERDFVIEGKRGDMKNIPHFVDKEKGNVNFFWIDVFENRNYYNGKLFLFGKVRSPHVSLFFRSTTRQPSATSRPASWFAT